MTLLTGVISHLPAMAVRKRLSAAALLTLTLTLLVVLAWTPAVAWPLRLGALLLLLLLHTASLHHCAHRSQRELDERTEQLRESELRLRSLIAAAPDIICFKDGEGRWLEANRSDLELFCLQGVDYRGKTDAELAELTDPIYRDAFLACEASDEAAWQAGTLARCEERIPLAGGGERVYDVLKVPVFADDGERRGLVVLGRDVTALRAAERQLRRTEERWVMALDGAGHGVWDWDATCDKVFYSHQWKAMLGYAPDEVGHALDEWSSRIHPDDLDACKAALQAHLDGKTKHYRFTHRLRCRDGRYKWVLDQGMVFDRDPEGRPLRLVGTHTDITAQKAAERDLAASEARYRNLVEVAPYSIQEIDTEANIRYANPASAAILSYTQEQLRTMNVADLMPHEHRETFLAFIQDLCEQQPPPEPLDNENITGDGRRIQVRVNWNYLHDAAGKVSGFVSISDDVTDVRRAEAEIQRLAFHDHLTGLPNRLLLQEQLAEMLAAQRRSGQIFALHMLDLDHFKEINDSLGHPVGDQLLESVAARICEAVPSDDFVARLGGDEFALVQRELTDTADASTLALKLIETIARPYKLDENLVYTNASIGILVNTDPSASVDVLMSRADVALYKAKDAGRAGYALFEESMSHELQQEMSLTRQLLQAIEMGELMLEYQPQFSLADGRLVGAEALLRWRHPQRGVLYPGDFLEVAEKRGLMRPVGNWVLDEVARQAADWASRGLVFGRLAINLCAAQVNDEAFAEVVRGILNDTGVDPGLLELEYTETMLMKASDSSRAALHEFSDIGISFAIDDFGTGFSSLMYLKLFHTDKLKIDREFVRDLLTDPGDAEIVKATIALGSALGLTTVAEGVEAEEQAEFLRQHGCDQVQGYLYARPMSAEALEGHLDAQGVLLD